MRRILEYLIQGFGWEVGRTAAKKALEEAEEKLFGEDDEKEVDPAEAARAEAQRKKDEEKRRKEEEKRRAAEAKQRAREAKEREEAVERELRELKKRLK